jgi:hypothetical protein
MNIFERFVKDDAKVAKNLNLIQFYAKRNHRYRKHSEALPTD